MTWLAKESAPSDPRKQLHKKLAATAPGRYLRSPISSAHLGLQPTLPQHPVHKAAL